MVQKAKNSILSHFVIFFLLKVFFSYLVRSKIRVLKLLNKSWLHHLLKLLFLRFFKITVFSLFGMSSPQCTAVVVTAVGQSYRQTCDTSVTHGVASRLLPPASDELYQEGVTHERFTPSPTVPPPTVRAPGPSVATRTPTCERHRMFLLERTRSWRYRQQETCHF